KPIKAKFEIKKSPMIKNGKYKLPTKPVTDGMGAGVDYKKEILTITKDGINIVINFKDETVRVNGVADTSSGIFTAKKKDVMNVLIKYIGRILGFSVNVNDDEIGVEIPSLAAPRDITVTPVGSNIIPNTINKSTIYISVTATITAGQATGGKAELYIGSKLIATDYDIKATDTTVTFNTSDGTPTNAELMALIPTGGKVSVKLYNVYNNMVSSKSGPTLKVDYIAPTLTGISSVIYNRTTHQLYFSVSGAGAIGDKVDVSKITVYDYTLGKTYQLTSSEKGSEGYVNSANSLVVNIGKADRKALSAFETTNMYIIISSGSFIRDEAGNTSQINTRAVSLPVTVVK
ncbi:MAG TPA: hypothetical protein GX002_03110, partial [Clostridiales bacterium]|nr:hypothetical protein [Clostridiales bacterium]